MWPTAEQRATSAASKKSSTKPPKPATKTPGKIVKLPKELLPPSKKTPLLPSSLLPKSPSRTTTSNTYRGPATLGTKKVRSSPTFQRLIVDGQSYVLVPEHEHTSKPTIDTAKADAVISKLRDVRNELFEDGGRAFNLAGKQIGIAIAVLRGEDGGAGEVEEGKED